MHRQTQKELLDKTKNLRLVFLGIERELEKIPTETENEFLSLSSLLRSSYERTWVIADLFSSASVLMSGHQMSEIIEEIRSILEKMDNHSKEAEVKSLNRIESFNQVLNTIENVKKELAKFRKISKDLRVLSTVANVYDTSVTKDAQGDSDFLLLVKDITKLSNVILSKSAAVKTGINGIEKKISYAVNRMMSFKERQYSEMGSVLLYMRSTFDALTKKYSSATGKFSDTSAWSQDISKNIEKAVLSMQYHDITVQKFERARKSFSDTSSKVSTISDEQSAGKVIKELAGFCESQLNHICKSRDELSDAVASIVTSMNEISRNAIALSELTHTMSASANMAGRSFFTEMKGSLDTVKTAFSELNETNLEVSKAIGSVNSVVGDITLLVNEIESIGKSANVIAMNAVRKASHVSKSGMAVGFFAKSIQKLWSESQYLTTSILEALESITSVADSLSDSIKQDLDSSHGEAQPMEQEMTSLINSLNGLNNNLTSHLAYMEEEVQTLSEEIDMVADRSSFLDNVLGIIDGIVSVLGDMEKNLRKLTLSDNLGAGTVDGDRADDTEGEEQRKNLLQLIIGSNENAEDEARGDTIEFFDSRYSLESENVDA
jgi:methyl-accepting chemotaxis protein